MLPIQSGENAVSPNLVRSANRFSAITASAASRFVSRTILGIGSAVLGPVSYFRAFVFYQPSLRRSGPFGPSQDCWKHPQKW